MKKYFYLILCSCALAVSSCSDFLNEVSKSSLTPENSFSSSDDWNKALSGAYGMLQFVFVGKQSITLNAFGTDEVEPFDLGWAAYNELKIYTFSASHGFLREHYIWCYDGIKRANTIINMPADAPVPAGERESMIAQAKFLRAIYYFDLVAMYGGVPMWLETSVDPDALHKPRESADAVYTQIVKDMSEAAAVLPVKWDEPGDKGRATRYAAYSLLGRFYLQWGKSDEALGALNQVIGKYSLYDNYADIFDPSHKNEEIENIFEVQFRHSGNWGLEGSLQSSYWGPRNVGGPTAGGGWGGFGPTQYLYDRYEQQDKRKQAFFATEYNGVPQTPPCIMKYRDPEYGTVIEDDQLNYIMMRYPDVLLMKAEALNNIDDKTDAKYECLNQVRKRAGISLITKEDGLTKEEFASVVLEERLRELCCEHHRRFDLLRFGKLAEQVRAAFPEIEVKPYHVLYPIPQDAIDGNDMMTEADQNPGY